MHAHTHVCAHTLNRSTGWVSWSSGTISQLKYCNYFLNIFALALELILCCDRWYFCCGRLIALLLLVLLLIFNSSQLLYQSIQWHGDLALGCCFFAVGFSLHCWSRSFIGIALYSALVGILLQPDNRQATFVLAWSHWCICCGLLIVSLLWPFELYFTLPVN